VVAGRLINGYSEKDYVLALLYRFAALPPPLPFSSSIARYEKWAVNVAGLKPIDVEGVENVNLSSLISKVISLLFSFVTSPPLPPLSTRTTVSI
jgi:hypothetical protein